MISIRPMVQADIPSVGALETASPGGATWGRSAYESLLQDPAKGNVLVAELGDLFAGMICSRCIHTEAEVMNLAVHPSLRRQGVGAALLEQALRGLSKSGARRVYLEVRQTNLNAIRLYRRFGFTPLGTRPGYYQNPSEDALVLGRPLPLEMPVARAVTS